MSMIEVANAKEVIVLVIPPSGVIQQRFIAMSRTETHDLITRLCAAISAANAHEEVRLGQVPDPQPPSRRPGARKATKRGK